MPLQKDCKTFKFKKKKITDFVWIKIRLFPLKQRKLKATRTDMKIRIYTDIMCVFPFTQLSTFLSSSNLCHQTWKSSGQLLSTSPGHPAIFVQEMKAPGSLLQLPCWPNLAVPQAHKLIPSKMLSGSPYLILSSAPAVSPHTTF